MEGENVKTKTYKIGKRKEEREIKDKNIKRTL
jgi:hypothetical protein